MMPPPALRLAIERHNDDRVTVFVEEDHTSYTTALYERNRAEWAKALSGGASCR